MQCFQSSAIWQKSAFFAISKSGNPCLAERDFDLCLELIVARASVIGKYFSIFVFCCWLEALAVELVL